MSRETHHDGESGGLTGRIFGPVPSRRLGRSLGVDVIPHKTCSFDCVYCECGKTTDKTIERREFCGVREVLEELEARLAGMKERPDCVTLSGSGEPTLYSRLGELIDAVKSAAKLPVAVITNASLLWMEDVREELSRADIVLPSLDAAVEEDYRRVNRPHRALDLARVIGGLETFLAGYRGRTLFEILLVDGYNAGERNLAALREAISRMRIDRVQLNTAVRPGTERSLRPLDAATLDGIRRFFGPRCEVIAAARTTRMSHEEEIVEETVLALLERRPCTIPDIVYSLGAPGPEIEIIIGRLLAGGKIVEDRRGDDLYYRSAHSGDSR